MEHFFIGGRNDNQSNWEGRLDEVAVFERALSESEIKNLTMRKVLVIRPANKGTKISEEILIALRGKKTGILPLEKNIKKIIGKKLQKNIKYIQEFSWDMI